jgi:hypothetical protein
MAISEWNDIQDNGVVEEWSNEEMEKHEPIIALLQYSITPVLQHSRTPILPGPDLMCKD